MNERYGKHTAPAGKTRRSAASAKPKRAAGSEGSSSAKKPAPSSKARSRLVINPPTPEFRKWRRVWWSFLGLAMALSTASFFMWRDDSLRVWGNWVLGAGYVMIFVAIGIDWLKLRPLRREWVDGGGSHAGSDSEKS